MIYDIRPLLAPTISIICAILIALTGKNAYFRRFWSISASVFKFLIVLSMLSGSLQGNIYYYQLIPFSRNIVINFRVDQLGMFFALVSSTLWVATTIYAIGYMEPEHSKQRFFTFFAICVSSTVGIAFAGNLFTLFIFYEMLTIATYPLVIHEETPEAMKAGRKYLVYTLTGGVMILLAIVLTFHLTGKTDLDQNGIFGQDINLRTLYLVLFLFIFGFGVKAAIIPVHSWLPSAMVAPVPVTALLHAVAVVKAGAFGIIRVIYNIFGADLIKTMRADHIIAYIASFTIIGGSIMAILQDNIKRRLAYSTISQLSYIILGAALVTQMATTGGIVHIANQAFMKITMFFAAGAIYRKTGLTNVSQLDGIGYKMPITMATFTISSLGMMGLPPFAGFITKWYLSLGALQAKQIIFVIVMALSSLLNAVYWLPIIYKAFFKKPVDKKVKTSEAHWTLVSSGLITTVYVILLGLLADIPGLPLSLANEAAKNLLR